VDTAERLIKSTQELLWERGYVGTSPKAIQQRAGAGQGSMYHHFTGKPDLARQAIQRSADELKSAAEAQLGGPGQPLDRLAGYLGRERAVLMGCQIGRLTQDPDVVASPDLREPVDETFRWLRARLADVIREAQSAGDVNADMDADDLAATVAAVLQGGYVLARAVDSQEPFDRATRGLLCLLRAAIPSKT
jgi:TetR/AcrR family transcriptional repressor of nem operon